MANKLTRYANGYLTRRNVITAREWKKIRGLMREAENDLEWKIKGFDEGDWHLANLNNILNSVRATVIKFDMQFKNQALAGMITVGDFETLETVQMTKIGQLLTPPLTANTEAIVRSIYPVTQGIIEYFADDMRKILTSKISLGIAEGQSTSQVATAIHEAFASSVMSYGRAERIAITEMLRGSSFVARERQIEIGEYNPDAVKVWINSHKPDARPEHVAAERKYTANPIPINQAFEVGGESGMMPRDFSFSAKNTVWCTCSMMTINKDMAGKIKERVEEFAKAA